MTKRGSLPLRIMPARMLPPRMFVSIFAHMRCVVAATVIGVGIRKRRSLNKHRSRNRTGSNSPKTTGSHGYCNPPRSHRFRRKRRAKLNRKLNLKRKRKAARRANGADNRAARGIR